MAGGHPGHSGLTPSEAAVMDRWDAGKSMQVIARELGRSKRAVQVVVTMYHPCDATADRDMRRGSINLLAAIQQARGVAA